MLSLPEHLVPQIARAMTRWWEDALVQAEIELALEQAINHGRITRYVWREDDLCPR